jgi:hypothetical protein
MGKPHIANYELLIADRRFPKERKMELLPEMKADLIDQIKQGRADLVLGFIEQEFPHFCDGQQGVDFYMMYVEVFQEAGNAAALKTYQHRYAGRIDQKLLLKAIRELPPPIYEEPRARSPEENARAWADLVGSAKPSPKKSFLRRLFGG